VTLAVEEIGDLRPQIRNPDALPDQVGEETWTV
jgi:hypothetical protein